ncbi:MAG: hypothetical protein ACRDTF_22040 [Pseudonocardiaceae bacterium]
MTDHDRPRGFVSSSPAARVSMPCTNPTDGAAPVGDSSNETQHCTGMKCTTIRYTAKAWRLGPYPTVPGRPPQGAQRCTRPHRNAVLVVLGDLHADLRDLMLLIAVHDPQIPRAGQVITTLTVALREPVGLLIRTIGPGQVRSRRAGLLALGPLGPITATPLALRRWRCARILITRGRARRVLAVA